MRLLGLTGSIASGKSTVSGMLARRGAHIIDADEVSRELTRQGQPGLERIREHFGDAVINAGGGLDRRALADIVFNDADKLSQLNAMLHPLVFERVYSLADAYAAAAPDAPEDAFAVIDMALLIETRQNERMDEVWLVTAPEQVRIGRIMARDGVDEAHARLRIAAQMPEHEKVLYADVVIDNGGGLDALRSRVDALCEGRSFL